MTENIHLIGADDVRNAGYRMREAAEAMSQVALNLDGALERHQRWMDDWLNRFAEVVERMPKPHQHAGGPL